MKKVYLGIGIFLSVLTLALSLNASSPFDIEFPILELGNCADKDACRAYCDDSSHKNECIEFARKHGLVNEHEAEKARELPQTGPGGCQNERDCRAYCEDSSNLEECISFGEKHGLVSKEDAKLAREFSGQTGPGRCRGANECRAYCEDPAHQEECLEFANRKGLISDRDAEVSRRVLKNGGPGGCRGHDECRAYCEDQAHLGECLAFGERHGLVSGEEALRIKKVAFKEGPGGCQGEEACHEFCENPDNQQMCVEWAVKNGFMSEDEAARVKKFAGKNGPGGCRGNQCREFCENPDNADKCLEFAEREGLMPPQEIERAKKFMRASVEGGPGGCRGTQCRNYCEDPAHQEECFNFAKKNNLLPPEAERNFESGLKIRQKMQESGGPGGCRNDEECRVYCTDSSHTEECVAYGAAHGGIPEDEVRRMLKDFTKHRFEAHEDFTPPEDFRKFEEGSRMRFEEFRQLEDNFRGEGLKQQFGSSPGFRGGQARGLPPQRDREGGFVGPGGCTSPEECIKYCFEHKEECFSFGPPGRPGVRPSEGGIPPASGEARKFEGPGHEFPQIRHGLLEHVESNVAGPLERCVSERLGPEEERRALLHSNSDEFFQKKQEALRSCEDQLRQNPPRREEFPGSSPPGDETRPHEEFRPPERSGEDEMRLREKLRNGDVFGCIVGILGEERAGALRDGRMHFDEAARQALFKCVSGAGEPAPVSGQNLPKPCPAMPTVDFCPAGQKKIVSFNSPECGSYYSCVQEENIQPSVYDDPAKICAEKGGRWDGAHCIYAEGTINTLLPPPTYDPAKACAEKGGFWENGYCRYPESTTTSPPPTYDPARACADKGGVWDGSYCKYPETQPHTGIQRKGFFASIIDFFWPR